MKVFVGYGYNKRDQWIEDHVFTILSCLNFTVVHGKDLHGQTLQPAVKQQLEQAEAVIGFFTLREDQGDADFTSHIWVRDEIVHALAKDKTIIVLKEKGAKVPDGLIGNRQYIELDPDNRLAAVSELVRALGKKDMRRIRLEPSSDELTKSLWTWRNQPGFKLQYRTQDERGIESDFRQGRIEVINQGFYLNVAEVPRRAYVEVEGSLDGALRFSSGWVSADAVQVKISA